MKKKSSISSRKGGGRRRKHQVQSDNLSAALLSFFLFFILAHYLQRSCYSRTIQSSLYLSPRLLPCLIQSSQKFNLSQVYFKILRPSRQCLKHCNAMSQTEARGLTQSIMLSSDHLLDTTHILHKSHQHMTIKHSRTLQYVWVLYHCARKQNKGGVCNICGVSWPAISSVQSLF